MPVGEVAGTLTLEDNRTRVRLVPDLGGAIASMEALAPGGPVQVLRPWNGTDNVFAVGCNLLVPFSNRISGGGFSYLGRFHSIEPNLDGEPLPIHGDGFQRSWSLATSGQTQARLELFKGVIGPFRYRAALDVKLRNGALKLDLTITNEAERPLPMGGGFHPWFVRTAATRLKFDAAQVWLEDERHLPTTGVALSEKPEWNFRGGAPMPMGWINNAFTGWPGRARIEQQDLGIGVDLSASQNMPVAIVYSPDRDADFFCFEPVSHGVDAHNHNGMPGLRVLASGESLTLSMTIDWTGAQ